MKPDLERAVVQVGDGLGRVEHKATRLLGGVGSEPPHDFAIFFAALEGSEPALGVAANAEAGIEFEALREDPGIVDLLDAIVLEAGFDVLRGAPGDQVAADAQQQPVRCDDGLARLVLLALPVQDPEQERSLERLVDRGVDDAIGRRSPVAGPDGRRVLRPRARLPRRPRAYRVSRGFLH